MEVILLLSCTLVILASSNVHGASIASPLTIISLDDLTPAEQELLKEEFGEIPRIRRSDSGSIVEFIKSKAAQTIKQKLSQVAHASGHMSSAASKAYYNPPPPPEPHDDKVFDFWDLHKSIFHTLLQAAKAIKGGLLAVKGQLIKGSGYLISAKGKLISAKGDAITNLGKHIATSAVLSPHPHQYEHTAPDIHEHIPGTSYGVPSGPGFEYQVAHHHKFPTGFDAFKDQLPRAAHHGILILKKIPKEHGDIEKEHKGHYNNYHATGPYY